MRIPLSQNFEYLGRKTTPNAVKTPSGGDRFIPSRSTTNFDLGHYKVSGFYAIVMHFCF